MKLSAIVILALVGVVAALETPVNLGNWFPHDLSGPNFGTRFTQGPNGDWEFDASMPDCVTQADNNADPTAYLSDEGAIGKNFTGRFQVMSGAGDDDWIGFVLGYAFTGDTSNPDAPGAALTDGGKFVLVHWKKKDQDGPNPLGDAVKGLEARLIEVNDNDNDGVIDFNFYPFWDATASQASETVDDMTYTNLQRAINLGSTGWQHGVEYEIKFSYTATSLKIWVDGTLEIDYTPPSGTSLPVGRFGFYNHSQKKVKYSGFTRAIIPGGGASLCDNKPCTGIPAQPCDGNYPCTRDATSLPGSNEVKLCFA